MRNKTFLFLLVTMGFLCLISCKSEKEKRLRAHIQQEITTSHRIKAGSNPRTLVQMYKQQEHAMNKNFVHKLEQSANKAFKRQLDRFEDEELGLFKDYKNMFVYLFSSSATLEREWKLKSGHYFSPLETRAEFQKISNKYAQDVNTLRRQMWANLSRHNGTDLNKQSIPDTHINLKSMTSHARNNIAIEVTEEILEVTLIAWLVALLVGTVAPGVGNAIGFLIGLILSVVASIWNDNHVISKLEEQYQEQKVSYDKLLLQLDQQTDRTYAPWTK